MRKKYIEKNLGMRGDYWDGVWSKSSIEEAVRFCEFSPLANVFERYFPQLGKILEGGCGLGQYVIYYRRRGYDIEGVDFAENTVKRVLEFDGALPIKVGNIEQLDYPDNYFEVYYSGGVIEHFEKGPFSALKEAHRVLKPNGILILTVPYINIVRKLEDIFLQMQGRSRKEWIADGKRSGYSLTPEFREDSCPFMDLEFHEYVFEKKEIAGYVEKAGFEILTYKGVFLLWGLLDFRVIRWLHNRMSHPVHQIQMPHSISQDKKRKSRSSIIKRFIVAEDDKVAVFRPILSILQRTSANLLLLVCRAKKDNL